MIWDVKSGLVIGLRMVGCHYEAVRRLGAVSGEDGMVLNADSHEVVAIDGLIFKVVRLLLI